MKQYLDIVQTVLNEGQWKSPVRKNQQTGKWEPVDGGVRTLACANVLFSHNMSDGFPLLTTKKMAFKTLCVELEGFIKGITDKSWFQERKCKIWDEWANPEAAREHFDRANALAGGEPAEWNWENRKIAQREATDLGPIYGYQWRSFDQHYGEEPMCQDYGGDGDEYWEEWIYQCAEINGVPGGTDQLKNIVDTLTNNPMDRRMVCSAWNPNQIHLMALPPCHYAWNVTVIGNELNLFWAQRSCDLMLGVPFNIASYALLLCLLAEVGGFERGNLSGMLVDCHIYENQIEAAKEQILRDPRPLPKLDIAREPGPFDIFNWKYDEVLLKGYDPHEKLDFGSVVV
jgi:thymidylate synthase